MTLLIKNVKVLGSAKPVPEQADVFVSGDKISAIGSFPNKGADQVIDGQGMHLAPGFIEIEGESDHDLSIFTNSSQENYLKRGVTTIICGQGGSSLAPLLYGTLEALEKWAHEGLVNVNWHTVKELLQTLEKKPLGVNFGTLVGHNTTRRDIIHESLRDLTKNELEVFGRLVYKSLAEGGFGLSVGLDTVHGRAASYNELKYLARIVEHHKGVYTTRLRITSKLGDAVDETIKLASEIGAKTLINNFEPLKGEEKEYEASLEKIKNLPKELDFYFDISPEDTTTSLLYQFLPAWAQNGGMAIMNKNLKDEWLMPRIIKDLPNLNPKDFVISKAGNNDSLMGKSLKDFMELYSIKQEKDALLKLMTITNLKATVSYKNVDEALMRKVLYEPRALIHGAFDKFLLLREQESIPLNDAVKKITSEPANFFGLVNRGVIREGGFADLVGFRGDEIKLTVVNGKVAMKDGVFQNEFGGRVLKHSA